MSRYVLKKVCHPCFISNLFYAGTHNAFYKNMYEPFGIQDVLVHPDLYDKLMQLPPMLQKEHLKLVIYDTFRPAAVQKFMYETAPDYLKPYIAPPPQPEAKRGFHPRGTAIDCYLADEKGKALSFPTEPDVFYEGYEKDSFYPDYLKKAHRAYQGSDVTTEQIDNREKLERLMCAIGLEPLPTEWWHFHLPNSWQYPIINSLDDVMIEE